MAKKTSAAGRAVTSSNGSPNATPIQQTACLWQPGSGVPGAQCRIRRARWCSHCPGWCPHQPAGLWREQGEQFRKLCKSTFPGQGNCAGWQPHHQAVGEPPMHADVGLCCCAVPRTADAPHLPRPRVPGCKFPGTGRSLRGRALLRPGLLLPVRPEKRTASPRSMLLAQGRPQCRIRPGCGRSGPAWRQLQQEGRR